MMQHYPSFPALRATSTNTSEATVSIEHPSQQAIRNIKAFARSVQTLTVGEMKIRICLN